MIHKYQSLKRAEVQTGHSSPRKQTHTGDLTTFPGRPSLSLISIPAANATRRQKTSRQSLKNFIGEIKQIKSLIISYSSLKPRIMKRRVDGPFIHLRRADGSKREATSTPVRSSDEICLDFSAELPGI